MATGLSLHVGLNQVDAATYDGWDGALVACENDARDMARPAGEAGFEATTLSGTGIEVREVLSAEAMEEQFQTRDPRRIEHTARLMPVVRQHEIYQRDKEFFQELQRDLAAHKSRATEADALLISACQDNQPASDGEVNGKFTATLLDIWNGGAFRGGYRAFHRDIVRNVPPTQSPNFYVSGRPGDAFMEQRPFTV
ncbi:caspase family protein [Streptomyces sp. NPDC127097]|uniref:caspase family protein n=1 Tax=Streptomyces sp. NPDC127097 TaxID=3347136 RepID=UPI00364FA09D